MLPGLQLAVVRKYTAKKCDTLDKLYSELEVRLARVCVREEPTASSTPLIRAAHRLAQLELRHRATMHTRS